MYKRQALEPAQAAALGDGLPVRRPTGSRYAYLAWEEDAGVLDALEALAARQKEALWRGFLQDGTQPMEFQWLWDAYREGAVGSLLEWELTLQLTLEALGFAVVNGAGRFTVTGPDGSARSFDLIRGGPAEKLFLKILFPLEMCIRDSGTTAQAAGADGPVLPGAARRHPGPAPVLPCGAHCGHRSIPGP